MMVRTETRWRPVPIDRVFALVSRLKTRPEIPAGSSLHVVEVHVVDHDDTVYRFFRGIADQRGIAADDEIEEAYEYVLPTPEPITTQGLIDRLNARDLAGEAAYDPFLNRDLYLYLKGPDQDGNTASPYAQQPKLTTSIEAGLALMPEYLPDWCVSQMWELANGSWSVRLTKRTPEPNTPPPEDFGRPKTSYLSQESTFKKSLPIAFMIAFLKAHTC
jgi:hypothetical protein